MALKKLDHRERDLHLENRESAPAPSPLGSPPDDAALIAEMRRRAVAAHALEAPRNAMCRDCWRKGRDAALQAVLAASDATFIETVDATCRLEPAGYHWREWWLKGRDAALAFVQGEGELEGA